MNYNRFTENAITLLIWGLYILFLRRSYFADDGIKYNIGRVPIGGTDFSTRKYTYADDKGVPDLNNFDLATEDTEYKVVF